MVRLLFLCVTCEHVPVSKQSVCASGGQRDGWMRVGGVDGSMVGVQVLQRGGAPPTGGGRGSSWTRRSSTMPPP